VKGPEENGGPDKIIADVPAISNSEIPINQIVDVPEAVNPDKDPSNKEEVKNADMPKYEGPKKRTLETMVRNGDFGTERVELILQFLSTETSKKRLKKLYDKLMPPSYLKIKRDTANTPELLLPIGARLDKVNRYL
jgi:hypothetical protein